MIVPESEGVLRHHVQFSAEHRKSLAIDTVSMACGIDIRTSLVDFRVNGESGSVDRFVTFDNLAVFVNENKVGNRDQREVLREGIEPCTAEKSALCMEKT